MAKHVNFQFPFSKGLKFRPYIFMCSFHDYINNSSPPFRVFGLDGSLVPGLYFGLFSSVLHWELPIQ